MNEEKKNSGYGWLVFLCIIMIGYGPMLEASLKGAPSIWPALAGFSFDVIITFIFCYIFWAALELLTNKMADDKEE